MVAEQLQNVRAEIRKACEKSGRNPEEVTLIAVSKTKPISMIQEAMDAGQTILLHMYRILKKIGLFSEN